MSFCDLLWEVIEVGAVSCQRMVMIEDILQTFLLVWRRSHGIITLFDIFDEHTINTNEQTDCGRFSYIVNMFLLSLIPRLV